MEQIIVTHLNGSTLKLRSKENGHNLTKATQNVQLLGADTVDISVESSTKLTFYLGDKITILGRDYTLNTPARERKISEMHFIYDLQFEGVQYDLLRAAYSVNIDTTSNQIQDLSGDSLTGDLKRFLDVLISNANRVFPGKWSLGTYPAGTETKTETFSDTDNCLSVLQNLCAEDKYNTEFSIQILSNGNRVLNVGTTGTVHTYTFEYGKGKGLYELTRDKVSSSNIVTRLNVYGSSKNVVTPKYRASKLCLPTKTKAQSFIEDASAIAAYGVWESTKNFDDIYPHRTGVITSLGSNELEFIDATTGANAMFDLNEKEADGITTKYLISGVNAKIHFNSGNLAGYEFEISSYNHTTKKFTIISITDENGYVFPSKTTTAFKVAIGDTYVITDIYLPQSYIDAAETALQAAGAAYLAKYSKPRVQYSLIVDKFFLKNIIGVDVDSNVIWTGDYMPIKDTDLNVDATIRVTGFTRDLLDEYPSYTLTISEMTASVSVISRMITDLKALDNVVKINNITDPAKARRNWMAAQEILNMVFDPEGDFYTSKIKPLSIDTTMLSVGAKSMQFGLAGTIFQPNYLGAKNRIVYTGGALTHYAILDGSQNPRVWNITDGDVTLGSDAAYYVYAKCARTGSGATILFSLSKITVESDATYFHFLIGIVNSVDANNARALALMYGFTTVNGRFIKTGRIQSADGSTYFDLDAAEFKGTFKFSNGTSVETAVNNAQNTANNIQVGGRNYLTSSEAEREFSNSLEIPLTMFSGGETISISFMGKYADAGTESWAMLVKNTSTGTSGTTLLNISVNEHTYTYKSGTITLPATLDNLRIVCMNAGAYAYHGFLKLIKIEKGNKPTDWTAAPEDVKSYADSRTQTVIDGGLVTTGRLEVGATNLGSANAGITGNVSGTPATDVRFWAGATFANRATAPFRVLQDGTVVMTKGQMTNAEVSGNIIAQTGNIGEWEISGGGIFNDSDTAYIIARKTGTSGYTEARIGSNVISAAAGISVPAWFMNTVENNWGNNIALLLSAAHGIQNKAIQATGDIVMVCGDAISSKLNYIDLYSGSVNVISIHNGLRIHCRNISAATRALYLPSLSEIRSDLGIGTFSVTSAAAVSSTTTKTYYVAKGNYLFVGDAIKYGASSYQTILTIDRFTSGTYDIITVETTLGVTVANGGTFTAIHEFSVEMLIIGEGSEVGYDLVNVYPNGATWYNNDGASLTYVALGRGDVIKVVAYTRRNVMQYQLIHYKTA